nr:hypothetical protein [Tanacetum cinerariifolium]
MMNELIRNQCKVTNHQVNVQFLLQLQPEWQRFVTLVKQSQELKTVSYHKLYDILKQHQHEVNEIRVEKIVRVAHPLALVAQQQPVYHPQTHPTHYNQNSSTRSQQAATRNRGKAIGNPQMDLQDKGVIDCGCSRHMTRNMSYLTDYKEIDGGYADFGGNPNGGKITGKVLLRVHGKNNMYSVDLKNIVPKGGLTCLFAKATSDESKLWHRMLGHLNFKTMNKLFKGNLVRSLPFKLFENDQNRVSCQKGNNTEPLAEAVNTACYVQNIVLVVKPYNKTPYELFHGRTPTLSFMRPFGCPVTILNTKDPLGKFDGKTDEEFFIGYSLNSKAFRVFNSKTRIVEENLHIRFSKSTPNVVGSGPDWLFDIDALIRTMNYKPTIAGTQSNGFAGTKASDNTGQARKEITPDDGFKPLSDDGKNVDKDPIQESKCKGQEKQYNINSSNIVNDASTNRVNDVGENINIELPFDPNMPALEDNGTFYFSNEDEDDDAVADMNNLDTTIQVSPTLTIRIHKDHPLDQVMGDFHLATKTRNISKNLEEHGFVSTIQQRTNHKDLQNCLFICFLSQEEPKKVFRNKKDESRIMIRYRARLVAQGHTQEEGIDYDEVFATVSRIEAIRLILDYALFKYFVVYQMDVKSAFLSGKIKEEVYVLWMNKPDLNSMSMDDLYNNLKVYEAEVKGVSSSSTTTQNTTFVSSSSNNNINNTNQAVNTAFRVTATGTHVDVANSTNIDNLSDAIICAFLVNQSNTSRLVNEYLEQYHPDDLEEMDLKWKMAMLTMRARRFLKNIGRKLNLNRNETVAFDKTKVEWNRESTRRNVPIKTTNSSALVSWDGLRGYDWSDQAEEGPNYALMACSTLSSDSEDMLPLEVTPKERKSLAKNNVLFNDTEYVVLCLDFKLTDENHVLLRVPRKNNMYSVDLKNIISKGEAVSTACYVQNRVLVVKPHNKTPYALFYGKTPMLAFMRPFGCPVTILNTIDHLGKFDGKADEGFFVRYSLNSKAFRVFNSRTRIVEEILHIRFSENTLNNVGCGPNWLFDIDALTKTMNYQPFIVDTQSND